MYIWWLDMALFYVLLIIALMLAVFVLSRQLGVLADTERARHKAVAASSSAVAAAGTPGGNSQKAAVIRRRLSAPLHQGVVAPSPSMRASPSQMSASLNESLKSHAARRRGDHEDTSLFSTLRTLGGQELGGREDEHFVDLLKAITYLDDTVEQSAYGFSVGTRKNGKHDFPWVENVLNGGPADSKLKVHERIVRLNSESTAGWNAERVKSAVLASPIRLYLEVRKEASAETRQEVLYRGRLGRVYILSQRCKEVGPCEQEAQCDTARALRHFGTLLEQALSIADLRDTLAARIHDVVCPPREREVFTKILAHALTDADGAGLTSPPGGPAVPKPDKSKSDLEQSGLPGSMIERPSPGRRITLQSLSPNKTSRDNLTLAGALALQDEVVARYNTLWKTAAAAATKAAADEKKAKEREAKVQELRLERDQLCGDHTKQGAALEQERERAATAKAALACEEARLQGEKERASELEQKVQELEQLLVSEKAFAGRVRTESEAKVTAVERQRDSEKGKLLALTRKVNDLEGMLATERAQTATVTDALKRNDANFTSISRDLQVQMQALEDRAREAEGKCSAAVAERDRLKSALDEEKKRAVGHSAELTQWQQDCTAARDEVAKCAARCARLEEDVKAAEAARRESEAERAAAAASADGAAAEAASAASAQNSAEEALVEMKAALEICRGERDVAQREVADAQRAAEEARHKMEDARTHSQALQEMLKETRARAEVTEGEMRAVSELEQRLTRAEESKEALSVELQGERQQLQLIKDELELADANKLAAQESQKQLEAKVTALEKQLCERHTLLGEQGREGEERVREPVGELAALQQQVVELEQQLAEAEETNEALDEDLFEREKFTNLLKQTGEARLKSVVNDLRDVLGSLGVTAAALPAEAPQADTPLEDPLKPEFEMVDALLELIKPCACELEKMQEKHEVQLIEVEAKAAVWRERCEGFQVAADELREQVQEVKRVNDTKLEDMRRRVDMAQVDLDAALAQQRRSAASRQAMPQLSRSEPVQAQLVPATSATQEGRGEGCVAKASGGAGGVVEEWSGRYQDSRQQWQKMQFRVTIHDGSVTGSGADKAGHFTIQGAIRGYSLEFSKSYVKKAGLFYKGTLHKSREREGGWRVDGTYSNSNTNPSKGNAGAKFELKVGPALSAAVAAAAAAEARSPAQTAEHASKKDPSIDTPTAPRVQTLPEAGQGQVKPVSAEKDKASLSPDKSSERRAGEGDGKGGGATFSMKKLVKELPFVSQPHFWELEGGGDVPGNCAPLLNRNNGCLSPEAPDNAAVIERAAQWMSLCGADKVTKLPTVQPVKGAGTTESILWRDAERTFKTESFRQQMITVLETVADGDYHQGMGYLTGFLLLLVPPSDVTKILHKIGTDAKYTPGYWKGQPEAFVRDAMVYMALVKTRFPKVAEHLTQASLVAEAYAQKWFVGLCVHVMPFTALVEVFEAFLAEGYMFLFKLSLALVDALQEKLLRIDVGAVNKMFELLRLDAAVFPDADAAFFEGIVAAARAMELPQAEVDTLRAQQWVLLQEKQAKVREREAEMKAAADSDDEITFSDEDSDEEDEAARLARLSAQ